MSYMHTQKLTTTSCVSHVLCGMHSWLTWQVQVGKHHIYSMIQPCSAWHVTFTLDHTTCNMGCVQLSALLEGIVLGGEHKWMTWGDEVARSSGPWAVTVYTNNSCSCENNWVEAVIRTSREALHTYNWSAYACATSICESAWICWT